MSDGRGPLTLGSSSPGDSSAEHAEAGRKEQSLAYFLPQDMELAVFASSPVASPEQFFRDKVTNLYLANIKPA